MKLTAAIFDLDGTVIADEDEWGEAFGKVLKQLGAQVDVKYPHVMGIGVSENWPILLKKYVVRTDLTADELASLTIKEYEKLIDRIDLRDGFVEFVEGLRDSGVKTALATSSPWEIVQRVFERFDIESYFDSVTTGEEVAFKKPEPQIFEVASGKLGVDPNECLVLEDSEAGIEAAHAAEMKVVGLYRDDKHRASLGKADRVVSGFNEISPELVASIE